MKAGVLIGVVIATVFGLSAACGSLAESETVYVGEHIITMDETTHDAQAVVVRGERIALVGSREEAMAAVSPEARVVELGDRALLPGFIDAHGHFALTARLVDFANLSSPPVGQVRRIDDVVASLKQHIAERELAPGTWVLGYGYDDSLLAERRHPTRDDLDKASTEHPILLLHVSGHLSAINSAGLAAVNYNADTDDPPGGVIRRRAGSREPNGVLEEAASSAVFFQRRAWKEPEQIGTLFRSAMEYYAGYGITTVQDGIASQQDMAVLRAMARRQRLMLDIVSYSPFNRLPAEQAETLEITPDYVGGFRVGGVKMTLDGSPQGRTAWLTEPYTEVPAGRPADYRAYPTMDPQAYRTEVARFIDRGVPVLVHANGDAAIDLMLEGVSQAIQQRNPVPDHRSVVIHAQLMRADQVARAKGLGVIPSFFSAHIFFWGDWHRRSFGEGRAKDISPMRWALDAGVPVTIHNDTPIIPPDMMRLLWATVTRTTRSGHIIGPHQRVTVMEALHAMTLGAAWQYFEERHKGSLTQGKQADMVILGNDPRTVSPEGIKDIPVLETIARGKVVFSTAP